jgi:uncharacterized protein YndB with AHSA1/START domain
VTEPFRTSVTIEAAPGDVFPYLVDADLIVKWMGEYAETEPIAGGLLHLDIIGVPVRGTFVTVEPPRRVVFTWGHAGSAVLPPGASTVEIVLTEHPGPRTVVELVHRDLPDEMAPGHARGWAHFVERLRIVGAGRNPGDDPWRHDPPPEARRAARK